MSFVPFFVLGWLSLMAALWIGPDAHHKRRARRLMIFYVILGVVCWAICGFVLNHHYHHFLHTADS